MKQCSVLHLPILAVVWRCHVEDISFTETSLMKKQQKQYIDVWGKWLKFVTDHRGIFQCIKGPIFVTRFAINNDASCFHS